MRQSVILLALVSVLPRLAAAQVTDIPSQPPPPPVLAPPGPADAPPGPSLAGNRNVFVLPDCGTTLPLRVISPHPLLAIRTGDIAPRPAAPPPGWTIDWSKPVPSGGLANEYASTGRLVGGCPRSGLFGVPLALYDDAKGVSGLSLTLVREAQAVLDIPSAATLSVDRLFGRPADVALTVRETEPGAAEARVSATGGELRSTDGVGTGIVLEPTNSPLPVRAGQSAQLLLAPSAPPAPGIYVARISLSSPALARPATVDLVYRVQFSIVFLLLMLLAGIALGWWVNLRIAAKAALDSAVLSGLRAIQATTRRVTPQRDPAVQQRLLAVANLLQTHLEEASSPDEINSRVLEAETQAKDIESRAVQTATGLQSALQQARATLRPGGQLDDIVIARLGSPANELEALQAASDGGDAEQTASRLQDFTRDLPGKAIPELRSLLADIQGELGGLGALPAGDGLEDTRVALQDSVRIAYAEAELARLIRGADDVARRLRNWMDLTLPAVLATQWRDAGKLLNTSKPMLAQRLGFAAEQAEQLRRASRDPLTRLGSLAAFRKTVLAALADAADGDRAVEEAVKAGNVRQAAKLLAKSNEPDPPESKPAPPASVPGALLAPPPASALAAAVRMQPLIQIGQDSLAAVRWIGERPESGRISWHCHPPEAASIEPTASGALVRPHEPGFVVLSLLVDGVRMAEARTYAGEVTEQNVYGIARRERRSVRLALTIVTALLTGFAGYAILAPGWLGTFGDFARAFLWGCFGQFGLDRLRELSRPLLSKTLPI